MKTIDVITVVATNANIPAAVHLFPIKDNDIRNEIVEKAEDLFISVAKELGIEDSDIDIDDALMDGYYECQQSYDSISIVWTTIEV